MTVLNGSWPKIGTLGRSKNPTILPIKRPAIARLLFIETLLNFGQETFRFDPSYVEADFAPSSVYSSSTAIQAMFSRYDLAEALWFEIQITPDRASEQIANFSQFVE